MSIDRTRQIADACVPFGELGYERLPEFYRCGICDCYHSVMWNGDCREDEARFNCEELDAALGVGGWNEVEMPTWENAAD